MGGGRGEGLDAERQRVSSKKVTLGEILNRGKWLFWTKYFIVFHLVFRVNKIIEKSIGTQLYSDYLFSIYFSRIF